MLRLQIIYIYTYRDLPKDAAGEDLHAEARRCQLVSHGAVSSTKLLSVLLRGILASSVTGASLLGHQASAEDTSARAF